MTDLIIAIPLADADWDDVTPQPAQSVQIAAYNDGVDKLAYLTTGADAAAWPPAAYVVGAWDEQTSLQFGQTFDEQGAVVGSPLWPLQSDYGDYINPLGNQDGSATGQLDTPRFQGHAEAKFLEEAERYPSLNRPFTILIERYELDPSGHGMIATMIDDDPLRDITQYRMTVFTDNTFTQVDYACGAFVDRRIGRGYQSQTPAGRRTVDAQELHFALTSGAVDEGHWSLSLGQQSGTRLFWRD